MSAPNDLLATVHRVGGEAEDLPFWQACREGRFLLHRCEKCARQYWPASRCVVHGNDAMRWVESSGAGVLYTYTIMHHAYTPGMAGKVPYVVGVIQLDEGPYFHSNIVDCAWDDVHVGMKLRAEMRAHESGLTLPVFRPA